MARSTHKVRHRGNRSSVGLPDQARFSGNRPSWRGGPGPRVLRRDEISHQATSAGHACSFGQVVALPPRAPGSVSLPRPRTGRERVSAPPFRNVNLLRPPRSSRSAAAPRCPRANRSIGFSDWRQAYASGMWSCNNDDQRFDQNLVWRRAAQVRRSLAAKADRSGMPIECIATGA